MRANRRFQEAAMAPRWGSIALIASVAFGGWLVPQHTAATQIVGSVSFSGGFTSPAGLAINVDATTLAQSCSGAFATAGACVPDQGAFASSFRLTDPIAAQLVFAYDNFQFTVTNLVGSFYSAISNCQGG